MKKCILEVYARVCGFFRPVSQFNPGKKEEHYDKKAYNLNQSDKYDLYPPIEPDGFK